MLVEGKETSATRANISIVFKCSYEIHIGQTRLLQCLHFAFCIGLQRASELL